MQPLTELYKVNEPSNLNPSLAIPNKELLPNLFINEYIINLVFEYNFELGKYEIRMKYIFMSDFSNFWRNQMNHTVLNCQKCLTSIFCLLRV